MRGLLLRLLMVIGIATISACGGHGGGGGGSGETGLPASLTLDLDALTRRYEGVDRSAVVEIPFGQPLDLSRTGARLAADAPGLAELAGCEWVRLYREDPLQPVPGTLYAAPDGSRLVFVPAQALTPGTLYRVVLSSEITARTGATLGRDLAFPLSVPPDAPVLRVDVSDDTGVQGKPLRFQVSCAAGVMGATWRFDTSSSSGGPVEEGIQTDHVFYAPGVFGVAVTVVDLYGRTFTTNTQVTVLPDLEEELRHNPLVRQLELLSAKDLADRTLAEQVLRDRADDVVAMAVANVGAPSGGGRVGRDLGPGVPLTVVRARPSAVPALRGDFAGRAFEEGRFLGVARFMGVPTLVAGGCAADGRCTLDLWMDEGPFWPGEALGDRKVEFEQPALNPTPAIYIFSAVVDEDTLVNLRKHLPENITLPLSRLRLDADNTLHLDVIEPRAARATVRSTPSLWGTVSSTAVGVVSGVVSAAGEAAGNAVAAASEVASTLWDFITRDELDLLAHFTDVISTLTGMDPAVRAAAMRDALSDVYDVFTSLASAFADDPTGVISEHIDPKSLVEDLQRFVDGNGPDDVASLVRRVVDRLNNTVDSLETNPFEALTQPLAQGGDTLSDLMGGLSLEKDAHVVLTVGTASYLEVQEGTTVRTFPLGEMDAWPLDDFLEELPSFPLSDVIAELSDLAGTALNGLQAEIGLYYRAEGQRVSIRYRVLSASRELYSFEAFLGVEGAGIEASFSNPEVPDTGLTITGSFPGAAPNPPPGAAGDLLEAVFPSSSPFPELRADLRVRFRGLRAEIHATTRPDVSFGAGVSVGFEVNYHVAVGGKIGGSIGISASMDVGDALDSLANTLKAAFASARDTLGLEASFEDGVPVVSFPDEDQLMSFLRELLSVIQDQAPHIFNGIEVTVSASGEVGGGVGAGGTGTGGAGADLMTKVGIQVSASAADMLQIAQFCYQHGSALLFGGLVDQLIRYQASGGDLGSLFDVDALPGLFREGLQELLEEVGPDEVDAFMNILSKGLSVTLGVSVGPDAEAEEVVSGDIGMDVGVSVSANGEFLLNSVLGVVKLLYEVQERDPSAAYERLRALDQPGVFPEIRFCALPLEAKLTAAIDEGVKVEFETSVQASWLEGTLVLEGDPYRNTGGAAPGPAMMDGLPAVTITASDPHPAVGADVAFTAHAQARPGTSIVGYTWAVDGTDAGTGDVLLWNFDSWGLHEVTVTATESDGRAATYTLRVSLPNQPPPAPTLAVVAGETVSPNGTVPFTPVTDPEGDPVTYEVEILQVPGNVAVDPERFSVDAEHHRIVLNGLPYGDYRVRIRAVAAGEPGPWSEPVVISLVPGAPELLSPENWTTVWYENCVTLEWDTDQESSQVQIASDVNFSDPVYSEWMEGTDVEICPSAMPEGGSLDPGWYYWRVRTAPLTGTPGPWSEVRAFRVQNNHAPGAPELVQAPAEVYYTRDTIVFSFLSTDPDGDPLTYTLYASPPDRDFTSTTGVFTIRPGELPTGEVVFRSIEVTDGKGGVAALSFMPWGFQVLNSPPDAPKPRAPANGSELDTDSVTLEAAPPTDFDGDPITAYEFYVRREGEQTWQTYSSASPSVSLKGLARGRYRWKVRARAAQGTQEGDFSEEWAFVVLKNHPPQTVLVAPSPGAVLHAGNEVELAARASDADGDPPARYGFVVARGPDLEAPVFRTEVSGEGRTRVDSLDAGTFWWTAWASDGFGEQPGPWSDPACFTVVDRIPEPKAEVEVSRPEPGGEPVFLRVQVSSAFRDCLGHVAGRIVYRIGTDPECAQPILEGVLSSNGEIAAELKPGAYYLRLRQELPDLESPWSGPLAFEVQGAPEVREDAFTVAEDGMLSVDAPGVLANDSDPNGDRLQAELEVAPAHGTVMLRPDGGFTYTPDPDYNGTDTFTYRASDGTSRSGPALVHIAVEPVNDPPVARPDDAWTPEDQPVVVDVLANDVDPDGDPLSVTGISTLPSHGTVRIVDSSVEYDPYPGYSGKDSFTYTVSDPEGAEATAEVVLEVRHVNEAPVIEVPGPQSMSEGEAAEMEVVVTDPEGDPFKVNWSLPGFCEVEAADQGRYSVRCAPGGRDAGTYDITVRAEDDRGAGSQAGFHLTVSPVNDPPVLQPVGDQSVEEGQTLNVELTAFDADGEDLTFSADGIPGFCSVHTGGGGRGTLTCSPAAGDAGSYTFSIRVTDSGTPSLEDLETITLTVTTPSAGIPENGDFEGGLAPWVAYAPEITGDLTIEVVSEDGSKRLHYTRSSSGANGGEMYVYQNLEGIDLSTYSEVYLECDVKLVQQTLSSSGGWSYTHGGHGEWPAEIRFTFLTASEQSYEWRHGFANFEEDLFGRTNYSPVPTGEWYHYRSPNLKQVQTTRTGPYNAVIESGPPVRITRIAVGGSGWDFEGYFDNVRLVLVR